MMQAICIPCLAGRTSAAWDGSYALPPFKPGILGVRAQRSTGEVFEEIGYFDEMHFAYLEDIDGDIEPGLRVMTIYTARRRWYGTSEAEPAVPSTIHSKG